MWASEVDLWYLGEDMGQRWWKRLRIAEEIWWLNRLKCGVQILEVIRDKGRLRFGLNRERSKEYTLNIYSRIYVVIMKKGRLRFGLRSLKI